MTAKPSCDDLLVFAAMADDHQSVARHLQAGAAPNFIHPDHGTALAHAIRNSNEAIVDLLLAAGVDPNLKFPGTGDSAMACREENCSSNIWRKLLEHGGIPQEPMKPGVSLQPTDQGISPAWLWRLLKSFETRCVAACCGWQAFDFSEAGVRAALEQGNSVAQLKLDLNQALAHAEAHEQPVAFTDFDLYWDKTWLPILHHLNDVIDQVAGKT